MPVVIAILTAISLLFIASASGVDSTAHFWQKQLVWAGIGIGVYLVASRVHYRAFLEKAHWVYWGSLVLLLALWIPGIGDVREGSRRWLDLGPISFQPAELAKIGTLLMVCSILARSQIGSLRESLIALSKVTLVVLIPFGIIFAQPDLGSAMVLPPMTLALLYVSNLTIRFFRAVALVALALVAVLGVDLGRYVEYVQSHQLTFHEATSQGEYEKHALLPLKDYQRNRILAFVAPSLVDPSGTGVSWNQRQSLITVGCGGLLGKGWSNGTQAKLGYLPQTVAHNDFIFSVISEETGFVGATGVLLLFSILVGMILHIAWRASDRFGRLLAVGVSAIFATHLFVNIAMTIGMMPIKGIPLPFVSYGGSFLLSAFFLTGMVASVERYRLSRTP